MRLEELKFRNKQLDIELSKSPSGAGAAAARFGAGTPFQMISMTSEEAFVVHGAMEWRQWVKLMVKPMA